MDQLSAIGIDNHDSVFHFTDRIVIDQIFSGFGKRAMQGNDIGAMVQFIQRSIDYLFFACEVVVRIQVISQYVHSESL